MGQCKQKTNSGFYKMRSMNFEGSNIGVAAFLIIGVFHPTVIKMEYHIGVKAWPEEEFKINLLGLCWKEKNNLAFRKIK